MVRPCAPEALVTVTTPVLVMVASPLMGCGWAVSALSPIQKLSLARSPPLALTSVRPAPLPVKKLACTPPEVMMPVEVAGMPVSVILPLGPVRPMGWLTTVRLEKKVCVAVNPLSMSE